MTATHCLPFPIRPLLCLVLATAPAFAQNPNARLTLPDLTALPGQTVTVPVLLDSSLGPIQGWSFSCNITAPLVVASEAAGSTTAAFHGGAGPDFLVATIFSGQGYTVGCVISFLGLQTLPNGTGYELHTADVTVPTGAAPGTVYPLAFASPALGNPPVATVVVVGGQSIVPMTTAGSITVGTPATVTAFAASDCPTATLGSLVSLNPPALNTAWQLEVQGLPAAATHGFYALGLTPVAQPMAAFGSPCTLRVSAELLGFALAGGGALQAYTLTIPNTPSLSGTSVYVQGLHDGAPVPPFSNFFALPNAYYFTNTVAGQLGL